MNTSIWICAFLGVRLMVLNLFIRILLTPKIIDTIDQANVLSLLSPNCSKKFCTILHILGEKWSNLLKLNIKPNVLQQMNIISQILTERHSSLVDLIFKLYSCGSWSDINTGLEGWKNGANSDQGYQLINSLTPDKLSISVQFEISIPKSENQITKCIGHFNLW